MPDKFVVADAPLETIVNVQWRGAVEFDDKSRIKAALGDGINTGRLLIALWARAPSEVLEALTPDEMVPLLQFGPAAPTVSNQVRPEYEFERRSYLERSEIGIGRNSAGRTYVGVRLVSAPFDLPLVVCPIAGFEDIRIETLAGTSTSQQAFQSQIDFGAAPAWAVYDNFEIDIDGHGYTGIGWWDINDDGQLNGILNCEAGVTAGTHVVNFRLHYYLSDTTDIPAGSIKAQLNLSHRAQAAIDARESFQNRVQPMVQPIVPDAWNCILVSADVSRPVLIPTPPYHYEPGDIQGITKLLTYDGYPEPRSLHKLYMVVNGRDYSPTTVFFQYGYAGAGDPGEDTRFVAVDKGGILPGRLGGDGTFVGFLWRGASSDNYPGAFSCGKLVPAAMSVAPWQFAISGYDLGLPTHGGPPTQFAHIDSFPEAELFSYGSLLGHSRPGAVELATVSIWTDLAADVAAPAIRRLFITDDGRFVSPKVAHKYFGSPAFFLDGGKTAFRRNRGSAPPRYPPASFEAIDPSRDGSGISDYSPVPKRAGKVVGI
jgi:hypothetical protein